MSSLICHKGKCVRYSVLCVLIFFKQSNDSWGGSTGHAAGDMNIYKLFDEDQMWCHHSDLSCNKVGHIDLQIHHMPITKYTFHL